MRTFKPSRAKATRAEVYGAMDHAARLAQEAGVVLLATVTESERRRNTSWFSYPRDAEPQDAIALVLEAASGSVTTAMGRVPDEIMEDFAGAIAERAIEKERARRAGE